MNSTFNRLLELMSNNITLTMVAVGLVAVLIMGIRGLLHLRSLRLAPEEQAAIRARQVKRAKIGAAVAVVLAILMTGIVLFLWMSAGTSEVSMYLMIAFSWLSAASMLWGAFRKKP